ncbi:hypothetical protein [Micromonospora sp. NPDC023633]|uniref:hypothetical protein n=1 Tax=Micromonospora sp. NPDC023633 TaxID=3154320 RepID=UPI0033D574C4
MTTTTDVQATVDNFNAEHLPGDWVRYWTGTRDDAPKYGQTRTKAELLGGHTPAVWVTTEASCIALTHVDVIPGQPDDIADDSRDLPELGGAAERVGEYIAANGDGIYDLLDGHPLYARDLEALRRAATTVAGLRSMVAELTAALDHANRELAGARADRDSAVKANTAWANQTAAEDAVVDAAKTWRWSGETADGHRKATAALMAAIDALPKNEVAR